MPQNTAMIVGGVALLMILLTALPREGGPRPAPIGNVTGDDPTETRHFTIVALTVAVLRSPP